MNDVLPREVSDRDGLVLWFYIEVNMLLAHPWEIDFYVALGSAAAQRQSKSATNTARIYIYTRTQPRTHTATGDGGIGAQEHRR